VTNVVMLIRDRIRLSYQSLRTLAQNTSPAEFTLTVVDDESIVPVEEQGWVKAMFPTNGTVLRISPSQHITGRARNLGVWWSERYWGRGEWLYLSDNDVAFKPGWLAALKDAERGFDVVGGYRHPYHGINKTWNLVNPIRIVEEVDAVAGYSQLMGWVTWDKYGPLDGNAPGTCQSEDWAFCQRIVRDGGKVGYVNPSVVAVCGITNTEGKPAVGWEQFKREPGLIYD